mmetsp:Transcript_124962/g.358774  ORF Transcript_124962/g.358774 Transcript_124962/m.358774 type:complete len:391 (+) Transcript_124962:94-1266(+)
MRPCKKSTFGHHNAMDLPVSTACALSGCGFLLVDLSDWRRLPTKICTRRPSVSSGFGGGNRTQISLMPVAEPSVPCSRHSTSPKKCSQCPFAPASVPVLMMFSSQAVRRRPLSPVNCPMVVASLALQPIVLQKPGNAFKMGKPSVTRTSTLALWSISSKADALGVAGAGDVLSGRGVVLRAVPDWRPRPKYKCTRRPSVSCGAQSRLMPDVAPPVVCSRMATSPKRCNQSPLGPASDPLSMMSCSHFRRRPPLSRVKSPKVVSWPASAPTALQKPGLACTMGSPSDIRTLTMAPWSTSSKADRRRAPRPAAKPGAAEPKPVLLLVLMLPVLLRLMLRSLTPGRLWPLVRSRSPTPPPSGPSADSGAPVPPAASSSAMSCRKTAPGTPSRL